MPERPVLRTVRLSHGVDVPFSMEAHILDGGHFLLETHAARATVLINRFLNDVETLHHGPGSGGQAV